MYLKELLDKAFLTEDPVSGEQVVLCPRGICQWCDVPLVVTVPDWESVYVQYRASEPDIELTFAVLMSNPAKTFLQEFANSDIVRARYQQLRVDWGAVSQEESDVKSETAETPDTGEKGESAMPTEFRQSDFGRPAMEEEYRVPPIKDEVLTPSSSLEDSRDVVTLAPGASGVEETPERDTSLSGGDLFSSPFMAVAEEPTPSNLFDASEEEETHSDGGESLGVGDDAPVMTLTPPVDTPRLDTEPECVTESAQEPEVGVSETLSTLSEQEVPAPPAEGISSDAGGEKTAESVSEATSMQQELVTYIKEVKETQVISLDVSDWARDCADTFAKLYSDFESLFETLSLPLLFGGNSTSAEEFMQKWAQLNWGNRDYDAEFYQLDSAIQFLRMLLRSYQDALKFCCYGSQEKAVNLAKLFAALIYEE